MTYTLKDAKEHVQQAGTGFHNRMVEAYSKATSGLKKLEGVDAKTGEEFGRRLYKVLTDAFFIETTGNKTGRPAAGSENVPNFIVNNLLNMTEEEFLENGRKGRIIDYLILIVQLLDRYKNGVVRNAELNVLPESERKNLADEIARYAGGKKLRADILKEPQKLAGAWATYDLAQRARDTPKEKEIRGGLEELLEVEEKKEARKAA